MRRGRAARGGGGARGLGVLALALAAAAALSPGAGCGGRSDLGLLDEPSSAGAGGSGAGGSPAGGQGGAPAEGAGGAAGAAGCGAACGGACGVCAQGVTACGAQRQACLAAPGCAAFEACALDQRCLDAPDPFSAFACFDRCSTLTAGSDDDVARWQAYTVCAACDPTCAELCPAASPLCGAGGQGGASGEGGAGGAGGNGVTGEGGGGGGEGGQGGEGGGGCGACVADEGPALCEDELEACYDALPCAALDACLRAAGCMTQPLDQFPLCALTSCAPFLFSPTAITLWNSYAHCALCSGACYTSCLPWSAGLCLFDPATGPLPAPPAGLVPPGAGP
ncbi:MAG TPA: hypothetical protein VFS43_33785 [Polyangiaceae bacterium]|nr:hypothetical protein [Polyangiaceae bacterium]